MAAEKTAMGSTRRAAGEAILELAREGRDVVAVSADTSKSMFTSLLREEFPERAIDAGIAEQDMMMICAGLASTGKTAFAASYSVFTSMRCCEQIRTFIAYPGLDVKIVAGIGGFSAGIEGVTHVATEDLGIMRCIAGMTVIAPSDAPMAHWAVKASADLHGPVYIRVGRDESPLLPAPAHPPEVGVPLVRAEGEDLLIVATGLAVAGALEAVGILASEGIRAGLVEIHTLKPVLHPEVIADRALRAGRVITVEEHDVVGGLATVVSELLAGKGLCRIRNLGLHDTFAESGTPAELARKYGTDAGAIVREARLMTDNGRK